MSKTIDEKVVSMQFDNSQFEANVKTSMGTLEKLKQSLNLSGVSKGFENVNSAAKSVDMSTLSNNVESVSRHFSALEVMAVTALANITNSAVNAGKKLVNAFAIQPITTGFQEYETQINAVQTILANTESKGTTLDQVNDALDELNTYADMTIYNFTEMTRNIGTFTAAGVDLETSVSAIKGIANLAAVSGSTSQQASTAMYQLSQALASGTVKLMDWNSVVNAGMGGQVFQDALKETARVHGISIDQMIEDEGSFRETLSEGWLSSEILTETLAKFTGDLTEEQLKSIGYTEEQIAEIMKLGQTANDAATKVKTFTQLMDTLKEAAQSGWSQTWEILVGDFEEAKELWTSVSDTFSEMIGKSADQRNNLLQGWKDSGGRTMLIDSLKNSFEGLMNIITPIKEAFRDVFPPATSEQLLKFTEKIKELTAGFKEFTEKYSDKIKSTFQGVFSVIQIGISIIGSLIRVVAKIGSIFSGFFGIILDASAAVGDWLTGLKDTIKEANIFGEAMKAITNFVDEASKKISGFFQSTSEGLGSKAFDWLVNILKSIWNFIERIADALADLVTEMGTVLVNLIKGGTLDDIIAIINGGILASILLGVQNFVEKLSDNISVFVKISTKIKDTLDAICDALGTWQRSIKAGTILKIAFALAVLAAALYVMSSLPKKGLENAVSAITVMLMELMGALALMQKMTFKFGGGLKILNTLLGISLAVLILAAACKKLADLEWDQLARGLVGVSGLLLAIVGAAKLLSWGTKRIAKGAAQMVIMAIALKLLVSVCEDLSKLSWGELARGVSGIAGILLVFAGFSELLRLIKPKKLMSSAMSLIIVGAAMEIMADVCSKFGKMEWGELGKAGAAIGGILVLAAGFSNLSKYAKKITKSAVSLVIIGGAMELMADVCSKFGKMEWEELAKAGSAIGGILLLAAGFSNLSKYAKKMTKSAVTLAIIGAAMEIMADVCSKFGGMEWEELGKAGAAVGGILLLAAGFSLLSGLSSGILSSAASLVVMAGALMILSPVLEKFSNMSLGQLFTMLGALAGVFIIFGVAGLLLESVVPVIMSLSGAIALFGLGCLAAGIGVTLLSASLAALGTGILGLTTGLVGAIAVIITGFLNLFPTLVEKITEFLVAICQIIIQVAPSIAEAVKAVVLNLVDVLVECLPAIVDGLLQFITKLLESLVTYLPQILDLLIALFANILDGLSQRIGELIGSLVNFVTSLIRGLIPYIPDILSAVSELVVAIFNGLGSVIGPLIQSIFGPILEIFNELIIGIVQALAPYLPEISACFTEMVQIVSDAIVKIIEILAPYTPSIEKLVEATMPALIAIANAFTTLVENVAPIIDSITNLVQQLGDSISQILQSVCDVLTTCGATITTIFEGISLVIETCGNSICDVLDSLANNIETVFNGIGTVVESVGTSIKSVLDGVANIISSIGKAALNAGKGFEHLANGVKTITELNLADMAASMAAVSVALGGITKHASGLADAGDGMKKIADGVKVSATAFDTMANGIETVISRLSSISSVVSTATTSLKSLGNIGPTVSKSFATAMASVNKTISSSMTTLRSSGQKMATNLASGMKSGSGQIKSAGKTTATSGATGAKQSYGSFSSAGKYLGAGLVIGINSKKTDAYNAGYALGKAAAQGEADGQKSESPSKLTIQAGKWLGEGLIIGMEKMTSSVYKAGYGLGETATDTISSVISKVSDYINSDIDTQPTIRPILDLSDVTAGASTIGSLFSTNPSVGVLANVGSISSMMNRSQNGATNNDVIAAINDLGNNLAKSSGDTYQINGVTYDDGSNITDAVRTLVRAARIERRV